jgi:hypothetical protein
MELKNGYKLIYEETSADQSGKLHRDIKASQTGIPAVDDIILTSNVIGTHKLVYEYKGKLYGTGEKLVPTYKEDGTPADSALISDEAFAEVFGIKASVVESSIDNIDNGTDDNGDDFGGETGDDANTVGDAE